MLAGGVGVLVILMLGWAVTRWWNGEIHALNETLILCSWIVLGLVVVLSLLWLGNSLEQRFQPAQTPQVETGKGSKSVVSRVMTGTGFLLLLGIVASSNRWRDQGSPVPSRTDQEKRIVWMSPEAFREQQQRRAATLNYWQTAVANLHGVRFRPPTETESLPAVFERLTRDFRQKIALARAAATTNVDPELVAMVQRHLEQDDRLLTVLARIPQLMQTYQVGWGTESAGQRALQWQQFQARLIAQPELWEKLQPEARQLIEDVVALEEQQQVQLREIELLQAVLQERYHGVAFPLPSLDP